MEHPRVDVLVGLDVGKTDHHATGVGSDGEQLFVWPIRNTKPPSRR